MVRNGLIRQGDILLVPVNIPAPRDAISKTEVILALGETTGHAHRLASDVILEWEADGQRYIRVQGSAHGVLSHEDHDPAPAPVVAPNQTYRVVQQREWNLSGQWKEVAD